MKKPKKLLKFICGATNEDLESIKRLSFIYASGGFNMIDTSANLESVNAVKLGIELAKMSAHTAVCASVGLKNDLHISNAVIVQEKCNLCKKCLSICPQSAIYEESGKLFVDNKKCIGCIRCIQACSNNAIKSKCKYTNFLELLTPSLLNNVDCIEFHCSVDNKTLILEYWNKLKSIYKGQLSICMNRSKLGDDVVIELLKQMTSNLENVIIQADGIPMSGGKNDYKSSLQTVAFAGLIRNAGIKSTLILSGGTNAKTSEFADICGVDIDGIAVGSYARAIVSEYVNCEDFWTNKNIIQKSIDTAKELYSKLF